MPAANVIQLRALLSEKFPGLRMRVDGPRRAKQAVQRTGVPQIDGPLGGGVPKGALTEIIVPAAQGGSASLIRAFLEQAAREKQIVAMVDGRDSLNVAQMEESVLSRLLWIRCLNAAQAMRAADLLLRDNNVPWVVLDLKMNPEPELRKIPAATWYRFQRLVEMSGSAGIVFTPRRLVAPAQARVTLHSRLSLSIIETETEESLPQLKIEVTCQTGSRRPADSLPTEEVPALAAPAARPETDRPAQFKFQF